MLREIRDLYYKTRKDHEPIWTKYLSRPFGAALAWVLRDTRVTPNQVSFLAFFTSLVGAAILVGWTHWYGLMLALVVYQIAYIIDCADGMLARLRKTSSRVGHLLDFLGDELKAKFFYGAVAVRLYLVHDDVRYLLLGVGGLLLVSTALSLTTFTRRPEYTGQEAAVDDPDAAPPPRRSLVRRAIGLVEWGARTIMNYPTYTLILAAFDAIEVYFFAYTAIYLVYVARIGLQILLRLGRPAPRPKPPAEGP